MTMLRKRSAVKVHPPDSTTSTTGNNCLLDIVQRTADQFELHSLTIPASETFVPAEIQDSAGVARFICRAAGCHVECGATTGDEATLEVRSFANLPSCTQKPL